MGLEVRVPWAGKAAAPGAAGVPTGKAPIVGATAVPGPLHLPGRGSGGSVAFKGWWRARLGSCGPGVTRGELVWLLGLSVWALNWVLCVLINLEARVTGLAVGALQNAKRKRQLRRKRKPILFSAELNCFSGQILSAEMQGKTRPSSGQGALFLGVAWDANVPGHRPPAGSRRFLC